MPNVAQTYDASNLRNHTTGTAIGLTIVQDTLSGPKAVYRQADPNSAGTTRGHGSFVVAPNYLSGNVVVRVQYRHSATSGTMTSYSLQYVIKTSATQLNLGSATSLTPTGHTVPGTAGNIGEMVFTLTSGFTPGTMHMVFFHVARATTDTAAGNLDILSYSVEYAADITYTKQYAFLPASVFQNLSGSPATLGPPMSAKDGGGTIFPYVYQFPDTGISKLGVKYTLPSTYTGNLKTYVVQGQNTAAGAMTIGVSMGEAAVGSNYDPALTTASQAYSNNNNQQIGLSGAGVAAAISPAAGSTLSIQIVRDSADTCTNIVGFDGLILEYDVFTASPSPVIQFNPTSLAPPTSNAASLLAINDTNNSGYIVRFTQGVDQKIGGKRQNPGIYSSGGTFVGYVKTSAATGNLKFHLEFLNPAIGAASDASPTTTATVTVPVTGANQVLRFVIDISPGLVAYDLVECLIVREGSTDAVAADADYLNGWMEVGALP